MAELPKAILIDLDDTILDGISGLDSSWRAVCDDAAGRMEGLDSEALFEAILRTREWYWSDTERHLEGLGFDLPDLAGDIAESYRDRRWASTRLFPGAVESLERLRGLGMGLGLVTNGPSSTQRPKLERFDLSRHFDSVIIEGEFGVGKLDSRVYLASMAALGSTPDQTWCVGDNLEWDVGAPQRLGIYGVWVDSAGTGLPADAGVKPDRTISSLAELP